jgi:hypothetical protein
MVWAAITSDVKTPLVFIENGAKVDQKIYRQKISASLGRDKLQRPSFDILQDSAPAHGAKMTQQWYRRNLPDFFGKEEYSY